MIVIIETLLGKLHGYVTDFISHSIGIQTALFTNPFSVEFYANVSLQLNNGDCINADTSVGLLEETLILHHLSLKLVFHNLFQAELKRLESISVLQISW